MMLTLADDRFPAEPWQGAPQMKTLSIVTVVTLAAGAAHFAGAQDTAGRMSFFITSAGPGKGADLGGLAGADKHCQQLAEAAGARGPPGGACPRAGGGA